MSDFWYMLVLLFVVVVFLRISRRLDELLSLVREVKRETAQTVIQTHTRQQQAALRSGPESPERVARRVGRMAAGQRRVVGGDPDSALYQSLDTAPQKEDDDG